MKHLLVLNGQYYSGENAAENKLVFKEGRSNAVAIDERRLRYLIQTIIGWFMSGEIELKRIEVLKVV
ncbi:hypothetical protein DEAC_c14030 [Desulfosporosinus acididurans]|uniref:Uncharacterized protein n=1 Tax=Desulfosporosinus acididurans TaxID=476652 RepID=A0A0J1FTD3_9FIRM|nr:hypothetical protein [Desulfosporosinus acididurans]KLU66735.1 hypothetical protein DEAC_c14030 [Desulfosporosinus acididurans]